MVAVLFGQRLVVEQLADNLVEQAFIHAAFAGQLQITQVALGEMERELCHRPLEIVDQLQVVVHRAYLYDILSLARILYDFHGRIVQVVARFGVIEAWLCCLLALHRPPHLLGHRLEEAYIGLWHGQRERVRRCLSCCSRNHKYFPVLLVYGDKDTKSFRYFVHFVHLFIIIRQNGLFYHTHTLNGSPREQPLKERHHAYNY